MPRPIQPTDLLHLRTVGEVAFQPDSIAVAFTISQPDIETDSYQSQIHLHDQGIARQLSYGHHDSTLRFSPSGERLAFVRRAPDEPASVQILRPSSGELSKVQGLGKEGVADIQWLDDERLVVLAPQLSAADIGVDEEELARRPRLVRIVGGLNEGTGWITDRLNTIEIVSVVADGAVSKDSAHGDTAAPWDRRRLEPPEGDSTDLHYNQIAVSPDGSQILAIATRGEAAYLHAHNEVHLFATDGSQAKVIAEGRSWQSPGWTRSGLAYASTPRVTELLALDRVVQLHVEGTSHDLLQRNSDPEPLCAQGVRFYHPSAASRGRWSSEDALFCLAVRGGTVTVDRIDLDSGEATSVTSGNQVVSNFDVNHDGSQVVAAVSSATRPAELWIYQEGEAKPILTLNNDLLAELDLAPVEVVGVPSTDGATVEAFVFRPPASLKTSRPKAGWPGLVYIHGGPTAAYSVGFFDEFQMAAAAGYVVIAGNPRGSDGYGDEWAEILTGKIGTVDFDDIMAISDHLVSLDEVDSAKVGIGGGSYGGLMTAWTIAHTDRFQAALIERCVSNIESFAGTSDIGGYFPQMLNGTTVEKDHAELRRQSPLSYASQVTTPVLVIHSDSDLRCPLEQGQQLFAAYRRNGVDATMVIFPGENHELSRSGTPKHRMERFDFIHDFYAKHLGGRAFTSTTTPGNANNPHEKQ